jgi:WD repeat-containing protein 35
MAERLTLSVYNQFVEHNDHPSLWALVATHALRRGDLKTANKAFVKSKDYHGVTFVKRLKSLHVPQVARAEIAAYFTEFDDAETLFTEIDRNDLALELRRNLGDWFRVEKLLLQNNNAGAGANLDDGELRFAWNNIGLYFSDRKRWRNAVPYFAKSRNLEALADCYTCLGEFGNLELVLDELCDASRAGGDATTQNKNLLRKTATAFAAVGMCDAATRAFVNSDVRRHEPVGHRRGARGASRSRGKGAAPESAAGTAFPPNPTMVLFLGGWLFG